jgi:hypothetical protein
MNTYDPQYVAEVNILPTQFVKRSQLVLRSNQDLKPDQDQRRFGPLDLSPDPYINKYGSATL